MIRKTFTSAFTIVLLSIPALAADNAIAEGFDSLSFVFDKNDIGKEDIFGATATADWEKNLFAWCRKNKEQIEINPDPQLIYSSIAVSHFDNLMEMANKSSVLPDNILSILSKAIKAKTDFESGNCPDLVNGLNKIRLKRFEGAKITEFVVSVPENYSSQRPWPLLLHPDPRRLGGRNGYPSSSSGLIDVWWHFPLHMEFEWKDYKYFYNILRELINIDEDRIYISGLCGNGIPAMAMALKHPDNWAECSMSVGNSYRHLAGNALNLPLIFVKGSYNKGHLVSYCDFAVNCFKYHGCRFFRHSNSLSIAQVRGGSVPTGTRDLSPYRVSYTTESLANPSAYWLQIDGREDENFIASVDAIVWGQSILVETSNVDAYTLNLELAPLDCNRPVEIIENNKHLDSVTGSIFVKKSPKYKTAVYVKNKPLHGPVADVFTDQYVVVWKGNEIIKRFAKQLAGSGPCFADTNLPADFVNTHNIVFVGRGDKSKHFAQIIDKLPVIIQDGRLTVNGQVYEGDLGAIFVYPNPLNPEKYLAFFSGTTEKAMGLLNSAWQQLKSNDNTDIGIFKVSENNEIDWLICEKFNTVWGWHESWDIPLVKLETTHPEWKWRQWTAKVLRKQLGADVMISEDPFASAQLPVVGQMTLRDISKIFKNDWIVKISIKGSDLKELLMVPFSDISSRQISAPVIDGASLVKQLGNNDVICISELEDETLYTASLPYKAVNGKRMGMAMKNYHLEDQGFLVTLLRDYLRENNNMDMDAELGSMKMNIF